MGVEAFYPSHRKFRGPHGTEELLPTTAAKQGTGGCESHNESRVLGFAGCNNRESRVRDEFSIMRKSSAISALLHPHQNNRHGRHGPTCQCYSAKIAEQVGKRKTSIAKKRNVDPPARHSLWTQRGPSESQIEDSPGIAILPGVEMKCWPLPLPGIRLQISCHAFAVCLETAGHESLRTTLCCGSMHKLYRLFKRQYRHLTHDRHY